jgi:hypothetical protein
MRSLKQNISYFFLSFLLTANIVTYIRLASIFMIFVDEKKTMKTYDIYTQFTHENTGIKIAGAGPVIYLRPASGFPAALGPPPA